MIHDGERLVRMVLDYGRWGFGIGVIAQLTKDGQCWVRMILDYGRWAFVMKMMAG